MHSNQDVLDQIFHDLPDGVDLTGTPGPMTIFGPRAFPIMAGKYEKDKTRQPIGVAAQFGAGAIVAFGHDCFTHPQNEGQNVLLKNAVTWASSSAKKVHPGYVLFVPVSKSYTNVGVIGFNQQLKTWQNIAPFTLQELDVGTLTKVKGLDEYDAVIIGNINEITEKAEAEALKTFVKKGGGLVVAATGWAFEGDIVKYPGNMICHEAGFGWTKASGVTPVDATKFQPLPQLLQDVHADEAWRLWDLSQGKFTDATLAAQLKSTYELAKDSLPATHPLVQAISENRAVRYHDDDLAELYRDLPNGVIPNSNSTIGLLSVHGPDAFTVLPGKYSKDDTIQVAGAAARYGCGRVAAFAHTSFTNVSDSTPNSSLSTFLANCVRWTANKREAKVRVGVFHKTYLTDWLAQNAAEFEFQHLGTSGMVTEKLGVIDVLVVSELGLLTEPVHLQAVRNFIMNGGGLVVSATAWAQKVDLKTEFSGNQLLRDTGIAWNGSYSTKPINEGEGYTSKAIQDTNADQTWSLLLLHLSGKISLAEHRLKQIRSIINIATNSVANTGKNSFPARIKSDLKQLPGDECIPSEANPITDALAKLKVKLLASFVYNAEDSSQDPAVARCQCHPATQYFPGMPGKDAVKLVDQPVTVEATVNAWYSTGLYAPPGVDIHVKFLKPLTKTYQIQIGSHSDDISRREEWTRCPELTVQKVVPQGGKEVHVHNAFGGLVYLRQTGGEEKLETVEMTLSGVIAAPYFVMGKTDISQWQEVRKSAAPWGELVSNKLILTMPTPKLAELENPIPLMLHWTRVLDAQAELAGIPIQRTYPERMVADVQISVGYMHSGYPVMIYTDTSVDCALSVPKLKTKDGWGYYHELGHNHQKSSWTYALVSEITNNMFAIYVYETVCKTTAAGARPDKFEPQHMKKVIEAYAAKGPNYKDWADDPWLGLLFYYQLRVKYGWDAYKKVFKTYQTLEPKPESEQDKVDTWMVQFSLAVGENLTPLFKAWGIELRDQAVDKVKHLPATDQTLQSLIQ